MLDWSFTYGAESGVWICTELAWYVAMPIAANSAFQQFIRANVGSSRALTLSIKMQLCQGIVMPVLLCSGETWAVEKQHIGPWVVFQMNCLRRICGIFLGNHVPSVVILNKCNTPCVESQLQSTRLRWLGHVFRMPNDRFSKKLLFSERGFMHLTALGLVALHNCHHCRISTPCRNAQDRLL